MIDDNHPAIYFEPIVQRVSLRTPAQNCNKRKLQYYDLSKTDLNPAQKVWVVNGLNGSNHNDPRWCALDISHSGDFVERYGISKQRIDHWKKRLKCGQPLFDCSGGVSALSAKERKKMASLAQQQIFLKIKRSRASSFFRL
jgi:hypothetical protein